MALTGRSEDDRSPGATGATKAGRAKRTSLAAAVALGALAWWVSEAAVGALLVFVLLMLVMHWPRGRGAARGLAPAADGGQSIWPARGMKAVVEALQEPGFIVDRAMLLRYRNPASLVAFGNMALGDPISLRFRSPELLGTIEGAIASLQPAYAMLEERRPERTWQVEIVAIPPHQGERPHFFLILFRDRTAELQIERMRTDFVANASHELRTPLASLTGFIETLQGPARNDAAARERFLQIMREQATRMSRLIDDLLSLSRIEMKRHVPIAATADLVAVLNKVRSHLTPLAAELGMTIDFSVPEGAFVVAGDEDELIQVFSNLVENACKYGESGKRVEMELSRTSERGEPVINASVRDFGPGIPAEHVPRLTERFYRVDVGSSRAKHGTGLGLSIVRNILLRHRSRLVIVSRIGEGSVFTARFPDPRRTSVKS